jgi:hypothetical protein
MNAEMEVLNNVPPIIACAEARLTPLKPLTMSRAAQQTASPPATTYGEPTLGNGPRSSRRDAARPPNPRTRTEVLCIADVCVWLVPPTASGLIEDPATSTT